MDTKRISSPSASAELSATTGTLTVSLSGESVTIQAQPEGDALCVSLIYNGRELFQGTASELELKLESIEAVRLLLQNPFFSKLMHNNPELDDSPKLSALFNFPPALHSERPLA